MSPASQSPPKKPSVVLGLVVFVCVLAALVVALFGAWVGTTLAIYRDGPVWLAVVGAVLCFAVIPLAWELWADRDQVGGRVRDAILRSAFLSLTLVTVLVATHPKVTFEALATRGDWFLGGDKSATAESVRGVLHTAANGLEWLNELVRDKAFRLDPNDPDQQAADRAQPTPSAPALPEAEAKGKTKLLLPGTELAWPLPDEVHPAVVAMPESAKASISTVGRYLKEQVPDPFQRLRAIHDFVATWLDYDAVALADGSWRDKSFAADDVFVRRTAVCEGYARLMVALGHETGDEVVYVSGDARKASDYDALAASDVDQAASSVGHAWNAARIGERWYLFDATWDAGSVRGVTFERKFRASYLFVPPEVMILDHRPDEDRFQLLAAPLDRATFLRQPLLEADGVAYGLSVVDPRQPIVVAEGNLVVSLANPNNNWLMLKLDPTGKGDSQDCGVMTNESSATLVCKLMFEGRGVARVFANTTRYGTYEDVFTVLVDQKP